MKFCAKCGNLLKIHTENDEKFLYCKSCDTKTKLDIKITISTLRGEGNKKIIIITDDEKDSFPVTEIMCPKCNEMRNAQWTMQQTRGGDEPPTRFYQCKACNWRWREYS